MNCKPGDLAIVMAGRRTDLPPRSGAIVRVDRISDRWSDCWVTDPPTIDPADGAHVHVADSILRPIRDPGDDATDETLLWLPAPGKAVTA